MKLLWPLSLASLGVQSVIGGPLVARDAQNSDVTPGGQDENIPSSSDENGSGQTLGKVAPWLVAGIGIPVASRLAYVSRGRQLKGEMAGLRERVAEMAGLRDEVVQLRGSSPALHDELRWLREEMAEARRRGQSPAMIEVEKMGLTMTLEEYELYLINVGNCRGIRLGLTVRALSSSSRA